MPLTFSASPLPPQDRSDHEVEKVKSALILCYGQVAKQAPQELVLSRIDADILRNVFLYFNTKVRPAASRQEGQLTAAGSCFGPQDR